MVVSVQTGKPGNVHGRGSFIAERVRSDNFWVKVKSLCANPSIISLEDLNGVRGADRSGLLVRDRVVTDRGGPWAPMFMYAEEDVDARLNQAGC